jgi:hypothetical protein
VRKDSKIISQRARKFQRHLQNSQVLYF